MAYDRKARKHSDDTIAALVLLHAARPCGTSKSMLRDLLYSYADRQRAGQLIQQLAQQGRLHLSYFRGGWGNGRDSTRAFVDPQHANNFAAGLVSQAQASVPKLHAMLDPMGSSRGPALTLLRKAGSSSRQIPSPRQQHVEPVVTSATRMTVCPSGVDQRYTVRELPQGYRSALDPRECRPWASAAAGAGA